MGSRPGATSRGRLSLALVTVGTGSEALVLASEILDPHSTEVHRAGLGIWQAATNPNVRIIDEGRLHIHAFVLALAFDFQTDQACYLTSSTFDTVHEAVASRVLDTTHGCSSNTPCLICQCSAIGTNASGFDGGW